MRIASTRCSPVLDHLDQRHLARDVRAFTRQVGDAMHRHQTIELRLDLLDHHLGAGGDDVDARPSALASTGATVRLSML